MSTRIKDLVAVDAPEVGASVVIDSTTGTRRVDLRAIDALLPPGWFVVQLGYTPAPYERIVRVTDWDATDGVPIVTLALASSSTVTTEPLYYLITSLDGGTLTSGVLAICARATVATVAISGGAPSAGDPLYVSDAGHVQIAAGTHLRRIGKAAAVLVGGDPATVVVAFDGQYGGGDPTLGGDLSGTASTAVVAAASGAFKLSGSINPTLSADVNDWNPTGLAGATFIKLNSTTPVNITGIAAQPDGTLLVIYNPGGSSTTTLKSQSASSATANRIVCNGADCVLLAQRAVVLRYEGAGQRWVVLQTGIVSSATPTTVGGTAANGTAGGLAAPIDHQHKLGFTSQARGDLPAVGASGEYGRVALGAAGQALRSDGTDVAWSYGGTATKTGTSYTIALGDAQLFIDTSSGAFTLTVPATIPGAGWRCRVMKVTTDANTITFARGSFAGNIQAAAADYAVPLSGSAAYPWFDIVSDGTNLWVQ